MNAKKIIGIGVGVGIATTGIGIYKLLSEKEPQKYSSKWFDTVSDEILNVEREIVRKQYCSAGDDFSSAVVLQKLLYRFDCVLSKRLWGGEIPHYPSYHREHGYNLFKEN